MGKIKSRKKRVLCRILLILKFKLWDRLRINIKLI